MDDLETFSLAYVAFGAAIALEALLAWLWRREAYRFDDTVANVATGLGYQTVSIFTEATLFFPYVFLSSRAALLAVTPTLPYWALGFLLYELCGYWQHRHHHTIRALWAIHVTHHSSEEYNLSVALRHSLADGMAQWAYFLPMALVGFPPSMFLAFRLFDLVYQFFLHTRLVGKLGPLDAIFNTPSNHRVHHARNPEYLDRNYGSITMLWDRVFGTYAPEVAAPSFGITHPIGRFDVLYASTHELAALARDTRRAPGLRAKLRLWLGAPDVRPAAAEWDDAHDGERPTRALPLPLQLKAYVLLQGALAIAALVLLIHRHATLSGWMVAGVVSVLAWWLVDATALVARRAWAWPSEAARCAVVVVVGLGISACAAPDPYGEALDGADAAAPDAGVVECSAPAPSDPLPAPLDPTTLPSCCAGAGRCVANAQLVPSLRGRLDACPSGGACEPESFVRDPAHAPAKCASLGGADGRCLSTCIVDVAKNASVLPTAGCGASEVCVPCVSPLDGKATGACGDAPSAGCTTTPPVEAGVVDASMTCPYSGPPIVDPNKLPTCGPVGGAHCLGASLVPAAERAMLATCPGGYCVPDPFIASGGNFVPATCRSVGGAEGRCLHESLPAVAKQKDALPGASCGTFERCVPCFDPLDGKDTGACRVSCDPGPVEPPRLFKSCCALPHATTTQGRCIPTTQIAPADRSSLSPKECGEESLCVPDEQIDGTFVPRACTANSFLLGDYSGSCLSACLDIFGASPGTCDALHTCAPCKAFGQSTGAPGCPP